MTKPTPIDESGQTVRAKAPVTAVSIPHHVVYNDGRGLVHSLDYVILLHLLFATAAGRSLPPPQLWAELKAQGIRSAKNSTELVGKNAVYESLARLIAAGYVRRVELANERFPGRKGRVVYEIFDNPVWNPDWQADRVGCEPYEPDLQQIDIEKVQVKTLPGTPEPSSGEADVSAGQNASRNAGTVNDASGVPGSGGRCIPAGQKASLVPGSNKPSPPLPPEEDSSSPYPSTTAAGSGTGEEEDPVINDEQIAAAMDFLQELPEPWQAGPRTAKKLAPTLATIAAERSWKLDDTLAKKLTENPGGIRSYPKVLAIRIQDLPHKRSQPAPRKRPDAQPVPQRPHNVVPSEEGMVAVRAALQTTHGTLRRP
ncbi:hypothetical protein [Streptomyces lydicus]|uniref:hypothetical protein n=1 Tax=Streptomyces lydicus TaxID=47763 RepID=UPI0037A07B47